jgi:hypothetical protein
MPWTRRSRGDLQCASVAILVRPQSHERRMHASDDQLARVPGIAYPLDFFDKSGAVDLERSRSLCAARVVVIGYVEGVSQEADVCSLQRMESLTGKDQHRRSVRNMLFFTHRCQVSILQASTTGRPSFHVDHDHKLDARVGHPTVHGDPLVEGVQEAKVVANGLCWYAGFEDVEAGVEHEGVF